MSLESANRIKKLICAIDAKTGYKHIDLTSAMQSLFDGVSTPTGAVTVPTVSAFQSPCNINALINAANTVTGKSDQNLTNAVQSLLDEYVGESPVYSFGVLSDLHVQYATGVDDLNRAFSYLEERVPFTCICGDLVSWASAENMAQYKSLVVDAPWKMEIYEAAGNHESYPAQGVTGTVNEMLYTQSTENPLYYSFEKNGDVFIMLSLKTDVPSVTFPSGALTWLENTLKANKNKRCFVFQHVHDRYDLTADPSHRYSNILTGNDGDKFLSLMKTYKNAVWFHGHTHLSVTADRKGAYPVGHDLGYKSVHIPSLVSPRYYNAEANALEDYYYKNGIKIYGGTHSEGYICDVYRNKIVLRTIDFAKQYFDENWNDYYKAEPMGDHIYALTTVIKEA